MNYYYVGGYILLLSVQIIQQFYGTKTMLILKIIPQ